MSSNAAFDARVSDGFCFEGIISQSTLILWVFISGMSRKIFISRSKQYYLATI